MLKFDTNLGIFHLSIDTFFLNFVLKNSSGVQKIVI